MNRAIATLVQKFAENNGTDLRSAIRYFDSVRNPGESFSRTVCRVLRVSPLELHERETRTERECAKLLGG